MTPSSNPSSEELDKVFMLISTIPERAYETAVYPESSISVEAKQDELIAEAKRRLQALIDAARQDTIDKVFELSPKALFKDWKPQDAFAFYERLKAYEQELKPPAEEQPTKLEGEES